MFVTDKAKFIGLVKQGAIIPSLKTYSDTLLFYYIGNIALSNNPGNLFEIGVGGSTYPLVELSSQHSRKFIVVDYDIDRVNRCANADIFNQAIVESYIIDSTKLKETDAGNLLYCHIDGSKDYDITTSDLEYCIENLAVNGIICQDDYGNNKWSTVTDAVQDLIHAGRLKMLIVGDSSCWLTRPEYYRYWMQQFATDYEFTVLAPFLNIRQSEQLHKKPNYLFMQAAIESELPHVSDDKILDYYDCLLDGNHSDYLQMPYWNQSLIGISFRSKTIYLLNSEWDKLRDESWPDAPVSRDDIDNLPEYIKEELTTIHKIDLYAEITPISEKCLR